MAQEIAKQEARLNRVMVFSTIDGDCYFIKITHAVLLNDTEKFHHPNFLK